MLAQVGALFRFTGESLFCTLFPAECKLCDQPLTTVSRLPVCRPCLTKVEGFKSQTCCRCGELLTVSGVNECVSCKAAPPPFVTAIALGPYEGNLRGLIHLLKYDGVRHAAHVLGRSLANVVAVQVPRDAIVVPAPLYRSRHRERSFNQAEEIADVVAKTAGMKLSRFAMVRTRNTESQTGKTAHQRRENVRGAFAVRKRSISDLGGKTVLLVDDVMTTGATAAECARVLLRAGVKEVYVATAARVTRQAASLGFASHSMAAGAQG